MRHFHSAIISALSLVMLAGCTPADEQYCQSFGVGGTPEFMKCMNYYREQATIFNADRARCETEADATYPRTLYDYGRTEEVGGRFSRGVLYGGSTVFVQPDIRHNMEVDHLRMRIVEPCMHGLGWNSSQSWQAGRQAVVKTKPPAIRKGNAEKPKKTLPAPLPWLF